MSIPRYSLRSTAIVLAIAALVVGGCGSDQTSSPVNVTPLDEAPPLAPTALNVPSQFQSKFTLDWADNVEPDLAGYRIYIYDPDPMRSDAFQLISGQDLLARSSMTMMGENGRSYIFRAAAVDLSGNESGWSEPFAFSFNGRSGHEEFLPGGSNSETPEYDPDHPGTSGRMFDSDRIEHPRQK